MHFAVLRERISYGTFTQCSTKFNTDRIKSELKAITSARAWRVSSTRLVIQDTRGAISGGIRARNSPYNERKSMANLSVQLWWSLID